MLKIKLDDRVKLVISGCCDTPSWHYGGTIIAAETLSGITYYGVTDENVNITYWHNSSCFVQDNKATEKQAYEAWKAKVTKGDDELDTDFYVHTTPGMYKTYNGPRIGEILGRRSHD